MDQQLSIHLQTFNNRIKVMNQTNSKELVLSALEARNLHSEIFDLLAQIAKLSAEPVVDSEDKNITIQMDGGDF